jgi:outer membrane lipoprotein-sorting protein
MDHYFPCKVTFSDKGLKISRFDFEYKQKILFARKTILAYPMGNLVWEIKLKQMVFNTDIPKDLFQFDIPPDYQRTS